MEAGMEKKTSSAGFDGKAFYKEGSWPTTAVNQL